MLVVETLQVMYDRSIEAVRNISLRVEEGTIVGLLGTNGGGKSTVLKAVTGTLEVEDGEIMAGSVRLLDRDLSRMTSDQIVRQGIALVPEGRRMFDTLTVEENLRAGGHIMPRAVVDVNIERAYMLFPRLKEKRLAVSGYLSGGEQQMVAIARALMSDPKMLILDEPSLGLAPLIVADIYAAIQRLNQEHGMTILVVEQNARTAISICDYAYVIENGAVVLDGNADALAANPDFQDFILGMGENRQARSMRDVKHYKRRKRWLS
ncbi:ABC transporter ATP-binding protein [Cupriavidus metallidurans]|uniref:ABC transporter ATP-binding protein n=1 Tax=Cupriavidus TaxID=106589 RepID=UPI0016443225|nr:MULTISPECIES: ABC transporter ATP-binding protein [Cupriavidus]GMG94218.1 ABC transporter ATP-binding protein [Cupriavidus sp. TKC]